jgi:hypothetical protein
MTNAHRPATAEHCRPNYADFPHEGADANSCACGLMGQQLARRSAPPP